RAVADEYDRDRLLLGETYVMKLEELMRYVVRDGLHLCLNFEFMHADLEAEALAGAAARTEALYPAWATPVWHASSHDAPRFPTRWCDGDEDLVKCALVALLSLRGACVLYQGDEIGMEVVDVPPGCRLDVEGRD